MAAGVHRLDQILSRYGFCSRSEARRLVKTGRVLVNGEFPKAHDVKVNISAVRVDGEPVEHPDGLLVLLHKPAGYVCSHETRDGKPIYELLPERWTQRNPPVTSIGRLDKDTTGVLLITDQGQLVQRWTSPKHKVEKVYEVTVDADLKSELVALFAAGTLQLDDEEKPCLPASLEILAPRAARLTLIEGKYHQVKRMFASQGLTVLRLHRSRFGDFEVGDLEPGRWRALNLIEFL